MRSANSNTAEWLDIKAVTEYASISDRTIRTWIHSSANPLPAVQVGGKVLVRRRDLDAWLESHRIMSSNEVGNIVEELVSGVLN